MCCHKDTFVRSFISLTPVSTIFSADEALPVRLQAIGQLLRTGEGDEMAGDCTGAGITIVASHVTLFLDSLATLERPHTRGTPSRVITLFRDNTVTSTPARSDARPAPSV